LEAVEKYEEVLHNLEFAKELQKTFSGLSQDVSMFAFSETTLLILRKILVSINDVQLPSSNSC